MSDMSAIKKIIAVSNGFERATYLLKKILIDSGRGSVFSVVPESEVMERGLRAAVLLTADLPVCVEPKLFPVCVMRFLPDRKKPDAFQSVITYSTEWNGADFTARNIRILPGGMTAFEIVGVGIIGRVRLERDRAEDVEAALAAAASATAAGVPFAEVLSALNGPGKE